MGWVKSFFGSHAEQTGGSKATALDVVTYTASLASNPREIDPTLDKVREISSRLKPGQALSLTDEKALSATYRELEQYLTEQESIRKFSTQDIRSRIRNRFPEAASKVIGRSDF